MDWYYTLIQCLGLVTVTKSFTTRRRSIAKPFGLFGSMIRFHTFEQSSIFASIKIASFFSFFYSMAVSIYFIFFLITSPQCKYSNNRERHNQDLRRRISVDGTRSRERDVSAGSNNLESSQSDGKCVSKCVRVPTTGTPPGHIHLDHPCITCC